MIPNTQLIIDEGTMASIISCIEQEAREVLNNKKWVMKSQLWVFAVFLFAKKRSI